MRLDGYDYAESGAYFVTLCAEHRLSLFGEVADSEMRRNSAGDMILHWWQEIAQKYPSIALDSVVVMPNHLHGILLFVGADLRVRPVGNSPSAGGHAGPPLQNPSLGDAIRWFKTMTTNAYIRGVKDLGWRPFPGKLWQRTYYDHIIRNTADADRIRMYIENNPASWADDENHPTRIS